jgi:hypothetical protein
VLRALYPSSGPPGTLVHVAGANLEGCIVKWDAGTPNERTLEGGFFNANFFTVPDAVMGNHTVRIIRDRQFSEAILEFTVTEATRRPAPRIDDITCRMFRIGANGKAAMLLMIHGANIDAGARVQINGVNKPCWLWRVLSNQQNMQAVNPATLGYPIFHYGTLLCPVSDLTPGTEINNIRVINTDGAVSVNTKTYKVAESMLTLDSDGDGLTDTAEVNGYDADGDGVIDIDLPKIGAHPLRKDMFLEVDWMQGRNPSDVIWQEAENVFRNAPILNSDGTQGIALHIDRGQGGVGYSNGGEIQSYNYIDFNTTSICPPAFLANTTNCARYYNLKEANFDRKRLRVYRYCICANILNESNVPGQADGVWTNDMILITLNTNPMRSPGDYAKQTIGAFLHEFGHTLGLHHGGVDNILDKPNYNSVVNYLFWNKGVDYNCNVRDLDRDTIYTYSQGMRKSLNENCLYESAGVCDNVAVDWNSNGINNESCVQANIDRGNGLHILYDYCDWNNLKIKFDVPESDWKGN